MNLLVPIAMFGWIPMVLLLFALFPPRRAVLAAFLIAWLFLPEDTGYKIPMIPAYTKMTAATLGTLMGVLIFDLRRLMTFRPAWIDAPVVLWLAGKVGSSISNGYGVYDGLSAAEHTLLTWGLPWLYGRLYFSDQAGIQELTTGLMLGGLAYVPLCLFEIRMSPQLHVWVYGFHQHDWLDTKRFGGWRPTVFMQHGLMVGMWMCMTGLTAWWLWLNGALDRVWKLSAVWAATAILLTAIMCKSLGAIALLAIGIGSLWLSRLLRTTLPLWALLALAPLYMATRLSGEWSGQGLLEVSAKVGDPGRVDSLRTRLNSENQFINAGWNRPIFGFRGWYNTTEYWDRAAKGAIPDALWMIEFTGTGFVGLASVTLLLLWPPVNLLRQLRGADLRNPAAAPATALAAICMLYMMDNLYNGMVNPIFTVGAGALAGWKCIRISRAAQTSTIAAAGPAVTGRHGRKMFEMARLDLHGGSSTW